MAVIGALALDAPASGCPKAFCGTPVGFQFGHVMFIRLADECSRTQSSLALGAFFGEDMAVIGALALDAPASGCPKALCGTPFGFQFGHFMLLLFFLRAAVSEPSETLGGCIPANIFRPACARRSCLHPLQEAFLGDSIMTICRPSMRGRCSTTISSFMSSSTRLSRSRPRS